MALELLDEYCRSLGSCLLEDAKGRGFLIYVIRPPHVRFKEIYVRPEHRKQGVGEAMCQLAAQIGKEQGCTHGIGSISLSNDGAMETLRFHLATGGTVTQASDNVLTTEWLIP